MRDADPASVAGEIHERRGDRHLLLLCDFDGTLVEFEPDPGSVWLPKGRRELLMEFVRDPAVTVGVISGRRLADVRARTALDGDVFYAGLHGLEIDGGGQSFVHPQIAEVSGLVHGLCTALEHRISGWPGTFVENKGLSFAVHYREATAEAAAEAEAAFDQLTKTSVEAGRVRVMRGAAVLELLPNIPWNKGDAVRWIATHAAKAHGRMYPVYFGDDVTDEDALRAVEKDGVGVASSERVTCGEFRVNGPAGVEAVLRSIYDRRNAELRTQNSELRTKNS